MEESQDQGQQDFARRAIWMTLVGEDDLHQEAKSKLSKFLLGAYKASILVRPAAARGRAAALDDWVSDTFRRFTTSAGSQPVEGSERVTKNLVAHLVRKVSTKLTADTAPASSPDSASAVRKATTRLSTDVALTSSPDSASAVRNVAARLATDAAPASSPDSGSAVRKVADRLAVHASPASSPDIGRAVRRVAARLGVDAAPARSPDSGRAVRKVSARHPWAMDCASTSSPDSGSATEVALPKPKARMAPHPQQPRVGVVAKRMLTHALKHAALFSKLPDSVRQDLDKAVMAMDDPYFLYEGLEDEVLAGAGVHDEPGCAPTKQEQPQAVGSRAPDALARGQPQPSESEEAAIPVADDDPYLLSDYEEDTLDVMAYCVEAV